MEGIRIVGRGLGRAVPSFEVTDSAVYVRADDPDHPEFWLIAEITLPVLLGWVVLSSHMALAHGTGDQWAAAARAAGFERRDADGEVMP